MFLPSPQLLRQRTARAIGGIAQAKIFVDLEQSLLSDQGAHEVALPRIAGKKSRRRDARRLIGKLGTQIFVIIPDFAVVIDCQWIN